MKKFSERKGFKKIRIEMQTHSIDETLRNRLWNVLDSYYWSTCYVKPPYVSEPTSDMKSFLFKLWHNYFKQPVDTLHHYWKDTYQEIRTYFFSCEWFEVYDFIEFTANNYPILQKNEKFIKACNEVLESELSVYRFVGGQITEITSKEEISEIEEALASPLKQVKNHLENALRLFSDRKSPDYRNSIKESISAVEATCNLLAGKKVTLGQCLKDVKEKIGLHGALEKAFSSLYGYTSEAEGIRHALMDEPTLSFEDAKFMLVSCSAFANYLISKASKAGIKMS